MKYELNKENVRKIVHSKAVCEGEDGLELEIDGTIVTIEKPYIDEDGAEMGNCIHCWGEKIYYLLISIEEDDEDQDVELLYRIKKKDELSDLGETPKPEVEVFLSSVWNKIQEAVQEKEKELELLAKAFKKQFGQHEIPEDLLKLVDFENRFGAETYSQSFYLDAIDKTGLKSWSKDLVFLGSFIEFANANGTGSSYAFWVIEKTLEKCPIVVFGDEGGVHVVAQSIRELLRLLSYDVEISVDHDEAYFYKDKDDYEESQNKKPYVKWLKENFDLMEVKTKKDLGLIMENAKNKYQGQLNTFLKKYGIEI